MPQTQPTNETSSESSNAETVFERLQQRDTETINGEATIHDNENTNFDLPGDLPRLEKTTGTTRMAIPLQRLIRQSDRTMNNPGTMISIKATPMAH